jgi:hypothetical protein
MTTHRSIPVVQHHHLPFHADLLSFRRPQSPQAFREVCPKHLLACVWLQTQIHLSICGSGKRLVLLARRHLSHQFLYQFGAKFRVSLEVVLQIYKLPEQSEIPASCLDDIQGRLTRFRHLSTRFPEQSRSGAPVIHQWRDVIRYPSVRSVDAVG